MLFSNGNKPDFIALDFETASASFDSACAIGIAFVKDLEVFDSFYSLLFPKNGRFDEQNIKVHGITPDMVKDAPTLEQLWDVISVCFTPNIPVLAHNAHFDMSVLHQSLGFKPKEFYYVDTIRLVSDCIPGSRSLDHCAECFNIPLNHHNAESDAIVCAKIAIEVLKRNNCVTIWEYLAKNEVGKLAKAISALNPSEKLSTHKPNARKFWDAPSPSEITRKVAVIDQTCPICNANVVFTGELSIDRREAMQLAVDHGAIVKSSVSRKTNYLIVGRQDKSIVGEDGMSTKEERAYELNNSGAAEIKIISEDDFFKIVGKEVLL